MNKIVKRIFSLAMAIIVISSNCLTNEAFSVPIQDAKLVSQYDVETTVDNMDTVLFGSYYQNDSSNKEPIEWLVLDRQGDKSLLLSKYILDCKCYNDTLENITWENCTLRNWLNSTFVNSAFSSSEQALIDTTNVINTPTVINTQNAKYSVGAGNNTNDKIFCLSIDEVEKYFNQPDKRIATHATNYAKSVDNNGYHLDVYIGSDWYNNNSSFWLRSPGHDKMYAAIISNGGYHNENGINVNHLSRGVRPALWVSNLNY